MKEQHAVARRSLIKAALMHAYSRGWLSFAVTERIARRLRVFRWFRHG